MKKFFVALSILALMNFGTCAAETVQVVGRGVNERMAIHDAMRLAIQQKFGAAIHSRTRTRNSMVVGDENSVDSAGFVSSFEVLSRRVENGIFVVEVQIEIQLQLICDE